MHIVRDNPRDPERASDVDETRHDPSFFIQAVIPALDRDAATEDVNEGCRSLARFVEITARRETWDPPPGGIP
jgi:hypothetical protein